MVNIINPRQNELFDTFKGFLSPLAYKRVISGWQGVFRHVILEVLPAPEIANHFNRILGRPTKELYSLAGILLIKEFMNWTEEEAADAYMFNADIQYALNLGRDNISMCSRTIQRYEDIFREDEYASDVMTKVTNKLISELELDVTKQRLDSTHIFSNMATFARTRLMGIAIKRFLTQLRRHSGENYNSLPEKLRNRYEVSQGGLFGDVASDKERRRMLRQEVAEEMYFLITTFSGVVEVENRTTYKDLVSIFNQQCDLLEAKQKVQKKSDSGVDSKNEDQTPKFEVAVKKKTGGRVIQNPADPEATYSGHKGAGYQAQIAETCSEMNGVQLITYAHVETSCEPDCDAVSPAMDKLQKDDNLPDKIFADTLYGSDKNVVDCESRGVELISPVSGNPPKKVPEHPSEKQQRLAARRQQEQTAEWQGDYNIRAGVEGTNSGLKRTTGLGQLRVRGQKSVFNVVFLKIAGWNILRAASSEKMKKKIAQLVEKQDDIPKMTKDISVIRLDVFLQRLLPRLSRHLAA